MSEVKWIKIATEIFDDEKILLIESMPEADSIIVIWFKLLCMAGKQNNSGVFMLNDRIAYTDEMLATIFRRNINTVRLALATFEKFGMVEIVNNTYTIPNWEKHQQLDALEKSRDATKKRVQRYRAKQKMLASGKTGSESECNVTSIVSETPSNADRVNKNRIDKNRLDNTVVVNNTSRARAREEVNHHNNKDEIENTPNAFGDGEPEHPDKETLEVYASNNIVNMNGTNMEFLNAFRDILPDSLIRYGIDMANKHCKNGPPTYAYLEKILQGFVAKKIKTVEQAQMAEKAREAEKERTSQMRRQSGDDPLLKAAWW